MRNKILYIIFWAMGLVLTSTHLNAQTATPKPSESSDGGYKVSSSVEFGVRGLKLEGSEEKYRSHLNYRPGFRLWDSSFTVEAPEGRGGLFDTLQLKASGWGADPYGSVRVGMDKVGAYKFDAQIRKVNLINRIDNLILGYHPRDTTRNFSDYDLTIFPESQKLRLRFGASFNSTGGERGSSTRTRDVFPIVEELDSKTRDFRAGVDTRLAGFKLNFTAGMRNFDDRGKYFINSRQVGVAGSCFFGICISPTDVNFINSLERDNPNDGRIRFGTFSMNRTFAQKLDLTGRFIYSRSENNFNIAERIDYDGQIRLPTGVTSPNVFVDDRYTTVGGATRYQARGDVGLTYAATDKLRISNTFTFDQFTSYGDTNVYQLTAARLQSNGLPYTGGLPQPPTTLDTRSLYWRQHNFKRFTNTIEADYEVNKRFSFFVGYRFTHRKVGIGLRNETVDDLLNRALTPATLEDDVEENSANIFLYGAKIKPTDDWSIYVDGETGSADNSFVRLANHDYSNFRVRSNWDYKKFSVNLSAVVRNNQNPSRTADYLNATTGAIILPAFDILADVKTRIFTGYVDYAMNDRWTFSSGYTYSQITSKTDTVVPLSLNAAQAPFPVGNFGFLRGFSEYYMKDNYFFVDVTGQPVDRVSLYASWRYNRDIGQGKRAATLMENFLSSYPFETHNPEFKVAIKLTRNIDWNIGYQYNSFRERLQYGYFPYNELTNTNVIPANTVYPTNENYRAHLPYTSLRIYFGKGR